MLRVLVLLAMPAAVALSVGGCPIFTETEGVLNGSWNATSAAGFENPNLVRVTLGFDDANQLTVIKYVFVDATVVQTSPANFTATTTVSGSDVTITVTSNGARAFEFTGTLNSTDTVITGTGTINITTSRGTIIVPAGGAITLTKAGKSV